MLPPPHVFLGNSEVLGPQGALVPEVSQLLGVHEGDTLGRHTAPQIKEGALSSAPLHRGQWLTSVQARGDRGSQCVHCVSPGAHTGGDWAPAAVPWMAHQLLGSGNGEALGKREVVTSTVCIVPTAASTWTGGGGGAEGAVQPAGTRTAHATGARGCHSHVPGTTWLGQDTDTAQRLGPEPQVRVSHAGPRPSWRTVPVFFADSGRF